MLSALEAITAKIREYNVQIETLAEESYPEVALLAAKQPSVRQALANSTSKCSV